MPEIHMLIISQSKSKKKNGGDINLSIYSFAKYLLNAIVREEERIAYKAANVSAFVGLVL